MRLYSLGLFACLCGTLWLGIERADAAGPKVGETFGDCVSCPDMVVVPRGEFMMGSPESESGRRDNEGPQHKVTIGKLFAVGKFEVTRDQFAAFVLAAGGKPGDKCWTFENSKGEERVGRSYLSPGYAQDGSHPSVCVSWDDAKAYTAWLSKTTGKPYRLLSEAEWEYAARAKTTTRFHYGDNTDQQCGYANGADETAKAFGSVPKDWTYAGCKDGFGRTAPSGSFKPNAFGLHDMHGNVWEWVEDCWHVNYEGAPTDGSAWTSGNCRTRVARSGSWFHIPVNLRSAVRIVHSPDQRYHFIGFRVGRMLP